MQKDFKNSEEIFVRLDCDTVGDKIELALFNSNPKTAQGIHDKIQINLIKLKENLESNSNIDILMIGSDDILFVIKGPAFSENFLENIKDVFFKNTGFSISIGVGRSLKESLVNLKIAKVSGKNTIVYPSNE